MVRRAPRRAGSKGRIVAGGGRGGGRREERFCFLRLGGGEVVEG